MLLLLLPGWAAAQDNEQPAPVDFPDFATVVDTLLDRYTLSDVSGQRYLRLLRAPTGYYVTESRPGAIGKLSDAQLFWSRETGRYQPLPYPRRRPEDLEHLASFEYNYQAAPYFDRYRYFGYYGYELDAIDELEPYASLSDRHLLQLARAYSDLAMNRLSNQYGFSDPERRFSLGTPPHALSTEQLTAYRRWQHEAIRLFRRLHAQAPDLELIVGDPWTKYSNEVMTAYLTLWIYQDEATAAAELRDSLYDPGLLAFARGTLADTPNGAILFCAGDNDFYPLLYLQQVLGVRPDVTLVSYPLLQSPVYRAALARYELDFLVPDALNERSSLEITFPERSAEALPLDTLFQYLRDTTRWQMATNAGAEAYLALPANRFRDERGQYTVSQPYVLRRTLNFMDLFHRYAGERSLCLSGVGAASFSELWLDAEEMQATGMVYRLSPGATFQIDTSGSVRKLLRGYGDLSQSPVRRQFRPFAQRYREITVTTALLQADSSRARQLLDRYRLAMPLSFHLSDPTSVELASAYAAIGDHQMGIRIARGLALHHYRHPTAGSAAERLRLVERLRFFNREWEDPVLNRYLQHIAPE